MSQTGVDIVKHAIFGAFLILIGILIPQTLGLSQAGFDDPKTLSLYYFYTIPIAAFTLGIILLFVAGLYISKDKKYGDSVLFFSSGQFPSAQGKIFKRTFLISMISVAFFSIFLGVIPKVSNFEFLGVTGVQVLEQQFTVGGNILFSNSLVPIAENLAIAFLAAIFITSFKYYAAKNNMKPINYRIILIASVILIFTLFGYLNHLLRYSDSDFSLFSVALFWFIGGVLTTVTGSFIPFWVMHILNNVFIDTSNFFGRDVTLATSGIFLVLSIVFIIITIARGKPKNIT